MHNQGYEYFRKADILRCLLLEGSILAIVEGPYHKINQQSIRSGVKHEGPEAMIATWKAGNAEHKGSHTAVHPALAIIADRQ